ncbi:MAG: hypothetical protein AB7V22_01905 [Kiritimatiellia bacterium]
MDAPAGQVQQVPYRPGMPDRRQRKPDAGAIAFRWLSLLVYPVLVVCVFIFVAMADLQQRSAMAQQIGRDAAEVQGSGIGLKTLLPLLLVGLVIGVGGMVLSKFRARRRSDYNYQTQLLLIILSVGGLLAFFVLQRAGIIQ